MSISSAMFRVGTALTLGALLAACAAGPEVRVQTAPDAQYSSFSTFGFPAQTGTDRGGYSTIVTSYFKQSVRTQMEARGFRYVEENPDLLVNFFANVKEQTEVRSYPGRSFGYYGYRYGLYDAWPLYDNDIETVMYPVGTANLDIVDAKRKQLIWEGVAKGRISDKAMAHPQSTITSVIGQLFEQFPGRAAVADSEGSAS